MVARTSSHGRTWLSVTVLFLDIAGIWLCLNLAQFVRLDRVRDWLPAPLIATIIITTILLYIFDTYGIKAKDKPGQLYQRTTWAAVLAVAAVVALAYMMGVWRVYEQPILWRSVFPLGMGMFLGWALITRHWMQKHIQSNEDKRRWLVVGSGERGALFARDFDQSGLKGRLHAMPTLPVARMVARAVGDGQVPAMTVNEEELATLDQQWTGIVVADDRNIDEQTLRALMAARLAGTEIMDLTQFYERHWLKLPVYALGQTFFVQAEGFRLVHDPVARKLKRVMDIVVASLGLVLLAPVALTLAILIPIDSRGPILFRQRRAGTDGNIIKIAKFRTMYRDAEHAGPRWARADDPRITPLGKWLRRFRLDEIPQLVNVLRGDMSIIGPRPERPEFISELSQHIPYYQTRNLIKPGITGWAQVNLPYGASVDDARDKLAYDLFYLKNYSLMLDAIIVLKTLRVVVFGRGT